MARGAKRKKTVGTASGMANMRDAATMRSHNFVKVNREIHEEGPGSDLPPKIHQLHADGNELYILGNFMGIMIDVLYLDLIAPSTGTPLRLAKWQDIAKEIVELNPHRPGVRKLFLDLANRIKRCTKQITDMIHYESKSKDLKVVLYDFLLKISIDHNVSLKGFLPHM